MNNPFLQDFDNIFNSMLVDWQNQFPQADVSQGGLIYMKTACLASAVWGIHKGIAWAGDQIFPDSAATENLEHHAWIYDITRQTDETDAELLARVLAYIRNPPAGGNQYDYENWAKEASTDVAAAYCIPIPQGAGSVDVIVVADADATGSEVPDQDLLDAVAAYIETKRPVGGYNVRALAPTITEQDVTMTLTGDGDTEMIASDITALLTAFGPGDILYLSKLMAIAINNGATNAEITTPAADVEPGDDEILRPGTISVS